MGAFTVSIELTNERDEILAEEGHVPLTGVRRVEVNALVDTGATMLVIPESVRQDLGLRTLDRKLIGIADGTVLECDVVGPIKVRFQDRTSVGSAIAIPGRASILFGALQMEEMDLLVDPLRQRLIPNPRSPERAMVFAVGVIVHGPAPR